MGFFYFLSSKIKIHPLYFFILFLLQKNHIFSLIHSYITLSFVYVYVFHLGTFKYGASFQSREHGFIPFAWPGDSRIILMNVTLQLSLTDQDITGLF